MGSPGESSRARKEALWAQEVASGTRVCRRCGETKPLSAYCKNRQQRGGLYTYCRACNARTAREYHRSGRERARRYNITPDQIAALGSACSICGESVSGKVHHIDHDHSCCPTNGRSCGKCVRGVLCHNCNTGLGKFRDSLDLLLAAAAYVEHHAGVRP